jgi:transcriptional regulator with GAF, ATPase, and Fis domain
VELVAWLRDLSGEGSLLVNEIRSALSSRLCISPDAEFGVLLMLRPRAEEFRAAKRFSSTARTILVTGPDAELSAGAKWSLLAAGVSDVLDWMGPPQLAEEICHRIARWSAVEEAITDLGSRAKVIGRSAAWRDVLRQVVEATMFSETDLLLTGETGTGKEQIARSAHDLDRRPRKGDFVIVDCTTLSRELMGSELFGHERGAFTGAVGSRDGAIALARRGTLFLDEIGELDPPLQAQLLRVIQERSFKRVGGNVWQQADFRLISATNRDLEHEVREGRFRADLYYRMAGRVVRLPPLRDRREDILPLSEHFWRDSGSSAESARFDAALSDYLMNREYPGNVRDLRRLIMALRGHHSGGDVISVGLLPQSERPACVPADASLMEPAPEDDDNLADAGFVGAIRAAITRGAGLKDIGRAASAVAIRIALEQEDGNLQRAARRLGVTDRALQLRRANGRAPVNSVQPSAAGARAPPPNPK